MMGQYLLMIYVTAEQEDAIKELFLLHGWKYKRKDSLIEKYKDGTAILKEPTSTESEKLDSCSDRVQCQVSAFTASQKGMLMTTVSKQSDKPATRTNMSTELQLSTCVSDELNPKVPADVLDISKTDKALPKITTEVHGTSKTGLHDHSQDNNTAMTIVIEFANMTDDASKGDRCKLVKDEAVCKSGSDNVVPTFPSTTETSNGNDSGLGSGKTSNEKPLTSDDSSVKLSQKPSLSKTGNEQTQSDMKNGNKRKQSKRKLINSVRKQNKRASSRPEKDGICTNKTLKSGSALVLHAKSMLNAAKDSLSLKTSKQLKDKEKVKENQLHSDTVQGIVQKGLKHVSPLQGKDHANSIKTMEGNSDIKLNGKTRVKGTKIGVTRGSDKVNLRNVKKTKIINNVQEGENSAKTFQCSHCSREFTKKSNYLKHIEKHTKQEFDCPECGKRFKNHRNMNAHRFNRSSKKTFTCDICGYETTTFCLLRIHMKKDHPPSDTLQCHLCPKIIKTKSYLTVHLKHAHGIDEGIYQCYICGQKCKRPKLFQKHLLEHEEVNQCQVCQKVFKTKILLRSHMRIHQERKHQCKQCGKRFTTITKLTVHERTHSGDKPFQCKVCDYRSTHSGNLRAHMKVHQREGENKTDPPKTETKTTEKPALTLDPPESVYGTQPQTWYPDKTGYVQDQNMAVDTTSGYTGQNMVFTEHQQGEQLYGADINYDASKNASDKHESQAAIGNEMYQVEAGSNQYSVMYDNMQGYTNNYDASQYYSGMEPTYIMQGDGSVTDSNKQDMLNDGSIKQYGIPDTAEPQNMHHLYQDQSLQSLEQYQYHHHQHHHHHHQQQQQQQHHQQQHQQHPQHHQQQPILGQTATTTSQMYPPPMPSQSGQQENLKQGQGQTLFTAQCYTDPIVDEHPNQTTYNMDSNSTTLAQSKTYADSPKSDFSNPNNRIYLGSQNLQNSLEYSYQMGTDLGYSDNPVQPEYDAESQVTYSELQQRQFSRVSSSLPATNQQQTTLQTYGQKAE